MLIVSYDIASDKTRGKFAKYLEKFGYRVQYSVFKIRNSSTFINNLDTEIQNKFSKYFKESDSVVLFDVPESCIITKYGHPSHSDEDCLFCV